MQLNFHRKIVYAAVKLMFSMRMRKIGFLRVEIGSHFRLFSPALAHDVYCFGWCGSFRNGRSNQRWRLFNFRYYFIGWQWEHAIWFAANNNFLHYYSEWVDITRLCSMFWLTFRISQQLRGDPKELCFCFKNIKIFQQEKNAWEKIQLEWNES